MRVDNDTIIMTNNSDKIRILWVWYFFLCCLLLELIQQTACTGEFHVVFKHFENLENLILNILKKNCMSLDLKVLFSWKPGKAFRVAQCTQPRLVKPCLHSNVYFTSEISGRALLETIVSHEPVPSLSQENRNSFPQHF